MDEQQLWFITYNGPEHHLYDIVQAGSLPEVPDNLSVVGPYPSRFAAEADWMSIETECKGSGCYTHG